MQNIGILAATVFQEFRNKLLCYFLKSGHNSASTMLMDKEKFGSPNLLWSIHLLNIKAPVVMVIEK